MHPPPSPRVSGSVATRDNGFGALRLLFASLVIYEHVGWQSRTPVFSFGTVSFGAVAVDGFFLVSGYLITASVCSGGLGAYLWKRLLRIYPAFVACSLLLLFVVRPVAGGEFPMPAHWLGPAVWMALLRAPVTGGAFAGLHAPQLDGSMWTIACEFRCYLFAALFQIAGVHRRPRLYLAITAALLALYPLTLFGRVREWDYLIPWWIAMTVGGPVATVRLLGLFMMGGCFRLFQPRLSGRGAAVCTLALIPLLLLRTAAEIAVATVGGYLLFWTALHARWRPLRTINARNDISYGVYLYGWPVTNLLLWFWRDVPFFALLAISFAGAFALGTASWHLIEKPALAWKHRPPSWRTALRLSLPGVAH